MPQDHRTELSSLFRRSDPMPGYLMETVRPIEVPVIALVKRSLAEGRYVEAVTVAYQTAVVDLQRAYRTPFPAFWTHRDVLQWASRNNLGMVPELLRTLYVLYEPVRYGTPDDVKRGDVLNPLTSLYAQSQLWRLYGGSSYRYGGGPSYRDPGDGRDEYDTTDDLRALPP